MSVLETCLNLPSVCTLFCEDLELNSSSPVDVVAACRDMNPSELLYHKLAAHMIPDKHKDDFQRALCSGWGTIERLLKESCANKLQDKVWYITDEVTRRRVVDGKLQESTLDQVLSTNEAIVNDLEIVSPLGKSDHVCFNIELNIKSKEILRYH